MKCPWSQLLAVLPQSMRSDVDKYGREDLQELRLRLGKPPEMVCGKESRWLSQTVRAEDIRFTVNTASRYSPWAAATVARGYITAPGGHRIGLCGEAAVEQGTVKGIREITSLCIRVARDFPGVAAGIPQKGNLLILGPPGSGKTTLLRDLTRSLAFQKTVTVVDERGELFPDGFDTGRRMDVLRGVGKAVGIEMALRTMGPEVIAVDEITAAEDAAALRTAAWCGVQLIATAHASCTVDLHRRPVYKPLAAQQLFDTVVVLRRDKTWYTERMVTFA